MHTYRTSKGTVFHYNSDFSGELYITNANDETVYIPAEDVLAFVAFCYVLSKKIAQLEQVSWKELLTEEK